MQVFGAFALPAEDGPNRKAIAAPRTGKRPGTAAAPCPPAGLRAPGTTALIQVCRPSWDMLPCKVRLLSSRQAHKGATTLCGEREERSELE